MALIRYPFHVKHAGRNYAPGEIIAVDNAAPYIARGAEEVPETEASAAKPGRKKAAKPKSEQ